MKWARDGEIDSFKVGSHTRCQRDEVLRVRSLPAQQRASAHEALMAFDEEHEGLLKGRSDTHAEQPEGITRTLDGMIRQAPMAQAMAP